MRKKFYAFIAFAFISMGVFGQNYISPISITGTQSPYVTAYGAATSVLTTNGLSAWQTLPFTWSFYGQPVTGFYASSNGYITFDQSATTNLSANTSLPDTNSDSVPRNAIFAFWAPLTFTSYTPVTGQIWTSTNGGIYSWTIGSPGNRVFYVSWFASNVHSSGSGNIIYFTLALFETGGFQVDFNVQDNGAGTFKATVGCQNATGTKGDMVSGSPNFNYPSVYFSNGYDNPADDQIYRFFYGKQPSVDLGIDGYYIPSYAPDNGSTSMYFLAENKGSQSAVANITYSFTSPKTTVGPTSTGTTVPANSSVNISLPMTAPNAGEYKNMKIWITPVTGTDTVHSNDTVTNGNVYFNTGSAHFIKHPFVEEYTGAWCGYCPSGIQEISGLLSVHWDAIVTAVHWNNISYGENDNMVIPAGETIASTFSTGFPSISVDRAYQPNYGAVAMGLPIPTATDSNIVIPVYEADLQTPAVAHVDMQQKYDVSTGALTVTFIPKFSDSVNLNKLMYNVYLVEETVHDGVGDGYDQHIYEPVWTDASSMYYNQGTATTNSYVRIMTPFTHRHVLRAALGGAEGFRPSLPNTLMFDSADQSYQHVFTTTVDTAKWNYHNIKVIGFVSYWDNTFSTANESPDMEVLGANQAPLGQAMTGIEKPKAPALSLGSLYPNPNSGSFEAEISLSQSASAFFEVTDVTGKIIIGQQKQNFPQGTNTLSFNFTSLSPGIYFLTVKSDIGTSTQKFVVTK